MKGIGPGTVLGGRYALRHRVSQGRDIEHWSGHDTTLEREVALIIVGARHPYRAGVLDAARRAAGVEDTRLIRILDVGIQNDSSFIVEEAMSGAESLATILLQGPLPAEEARRVAGETARGLETAGQRGLHHLRLTPEYVLIAPDGAIRISGVAVAAAIDGPSEQEPDGATASRRDALCLAAVVYAALTGRWPLDQKVPGIEPAPRMIKGAVCPSEIAAGVPDDLNTLCRMTLNEANGPATPGDFANQIAPWSQQRVQRDELEPTMTLPVPGRGVTSDGAPVSDIEGSDVGAEPTAAISTHDPAADKAAARAASTKTRGAALSSAGAAAGAVGAKLSSFARAASQKGARTKPGHDRERMRLPGGLLTPLDDDGPPLPMLPASTALPPSRGQSKIVVLVVATFVGLALFIGYRGLLGPSSESSLGTPTPRRTVTVTAPAVTVSASPAAQPGASAGSPIAILSATGFDPQGDQVENNTQAAHVYDGDLATRWASEGYGTAQFGNLKKGVGVLLDLGQPTSVKQVTIDLGSGPVDVTVYAATDQRLEGATVIGTASKASGRIQLKPTSTMPKAQYVIVWFTSLAPDGNQFRASISEIALS